MAITVVVLVALVLLSVASPLGSSRPNGPSCEQDCSNTSLKIWFGYAKQELACFRPGALQHLAGGEESEALLMGADMVVLLELAKRPSEDDMTKDGRSVKFEMESCESKGGVGLDAQMLQKLDARLQLVQVHQYAEDDPEEVDQALLSVWYDPQKLEPGLALAYKNTFGGDPSVCQEVVPAKRGLLNVTRDKFVSRCPQASGWPEYGSSKASLVTSWIPTAPCARPFAVWGANLPATYYTGKNEMVRRVMQDIESKLKVSRSRTLILGDMNTRLLNDAWVVCRSASCHAPPDLQKQLELAKQPWETIPGRTEAEGDIKPCTELGPDGGYASEGACKHAMDTIASCRRDCIGCLVSNQSELDAAGQVWAALDPKRGAGGFDLLAEYFNYPPDRVVEATSAGPRIGGQRLPTYKRVKDSDVEACSSDSPFFGFCDESPCRRAAAARGSGSCANSSGDCFKETAATKSDRLPDTDPVVSHRGERMVKPQIGWLDSLGTSKALERCVAVSMYEDRPALTFGDHVPFVAALTLDLLSCPCDARTITG